MAQKREQTVGERFKELRTRAHMSLDKLAKAVDLKYGSSLQDYENPERTEYIKVSLVEKLAHVLVGKGQPPISTEAVYRLAGPLPDMPKQDRPSFVSFDEHGLAQAISLARKLLRKGGTEPTDELLAEAIMEVYAHAIRKGGDQRGSQEPE